MNDKLYFSFLPTRLRVSELGKGTSEEILEKVNKTNQTSTSIKSNCSQIKSVNWGPSQPERTNSKIHEARQARERNKAGFRQHGVVGITGN